MMTQTSTTVTTGCRGRLTTSMLRLPAALPLSSTVFELSSALDSQSSSHPGRCVWLQFAVLCLLAAI